jgi:hypothetical protein
MAEAFSDMASPSFALLDMAVSKKPATAEVNPCSVKADLTCVTIEPAPTDEIAVSMRPDTVVL